MDAFPELDEYDVTSRSMGAPGEDLLFSTRARKLFPFSAECKHHAAISAYKWLEQRQTSDFPPIVFAKANHKEPIVILYASEFLKLIKKD